MTAALLPGATPIAEALDGADSCSLISSDGAAGSLSFNQLQASIHHATGMNVTAEQAPQNLCSNFNASTVGYKSQVPVEQQPDMTPELTATEQQQNMPPSFG